MISTESPIGASRMEEAATGCLRRYLTRYATDPAPWRRYDVRRSDAGHVDGRFDLVTEVEHPREVLVDVQLPVNPRDPGSEATRWGSLVHALLELHARLELDSRFAADPWQVRDLAENPDLPSAMAFLAQVASRDPLGDVGLRVVGGLEEVLWMPDPVHCQRLDALAVDCHGALWAVDYKTTGPWAPKQAWTRSFQMAGFDVLGAANFGPRWGGVAVVELVADKRQLVRALTHQLRGFDRAAFVSSLRAGQTRVEVALEAVETGRVQRPSDLPGLYGGDCVSWGRPCPAVDVCHPAWGS